MNTAALCLNTATAATLGGPAPPGVADGADTAFLVVAAADGTVAGKSMPRPIAMRVAKRARAMETVARALVAL